MTGFFIQSTAASAAGIGAGAISYYLLPGLDAIAIATITASGFIGGHLPKIQQPTLPSYRVLRLASWLATLLIPMALFFYRPTELIPAWLMAFILTTGLWSIIDRISLQRDYTHSIIGISLLPLLVTVCAYIALGSSIVIPSFLASSTGYILHLFIEQRLNRVQQTTRPLHKPETNV